MLLLSKNRISAKAGRTAGEGHQYQKNPALVERLGCLRRICSILTGKFNFIPFCLGFKFHVFKTAIIFKCLKSATKLGFKRSRTQKISSNVCVSITSHVHPQRLDANYWKLICSLWLKIFLALLLTLQNLTSLLSMTDGNSSV